MLAIITEYDDVAMNIPSEMGRLVMIVTEGVGKGKGSKETKHDLLDCSTIIPESTLQAGFKESKDVVDSGAALCIDPSKAETTMFASGNTLTGE